MSDNHDAAHAEYESRQREQACLYAAYFIAHGKDRGTAIATAKEAVNEISNIPSGEENFWKLEDLAAQYDLPSEDQLGTAQIKSIAKDIQESFANFPPH